MSLLRSIAAGLRSLFRKKEVDRELDEELRAYLEMADEEKMKQGMSPKEALPTVRLERGSLEVTKEVVRAASWESFVETCWRDVRFGLRTLRKSPALTVVAVLTLALGIGANAAIFTLIDAVMLKSLPVANPTQLYRLGDNNNCCVMVGTQNGGSFVFVLDLRNNPGGFVSASRDVASLFLGEKVLYYSMDRTGASREVVGAGAPLTDKPLVVLVNDATTSAAELLAGALKDNHRALLVGSTTFGQGLVHSVQTLSDGSGLVVAIAHFKTPSGQEVHRKGIEPDLRVEAPRQLLAPSEVATSKDLQYEKAVETLLQRINS
jgi:hypothetical protein